MNEENKLTNRQTDRQTNEHSDRLVNKQIDRGQKDRWTNEGANNTKKALGTKIKKEEIRKRRNREKKAGDWNSKVSINLFFHTTIKWSTKVEENSYRILSEQCQWPKFKSFFQTSLYMNNPASL